MKTDSGLCNQSNLTKMDELLLDLAKKLNLSEGGFSTEPVVDFRWATGWKVKTIIDLIPDLYEYKGKRKNANNSRSSYGLKHEVERLFQTVVPELSHLHTNWVGNGELILAMEFCGYEHYAKNGPNAYYNLKEYSRGLANKGGVLKLIARDKDMTVKEYLRKKVAESS